MLKMLGLASVLGALSACTAENSPCSTGSEGCACYGNDTCNLGLTCDATSVCALLQEAEGVDKSVATEEEPSSTNGLPREDAGNEPNDPGPPEPPDPASDVPTSEVPTGDVPTSEVPTGDVPTSEVPTGEPEPPAEPEMSAMDAGAVESCEPFPVNLTGNTTIVPGCYEVAVVPSMAPNMTLILSAGVTLYFADGIWLEGPEEGEIVAVGTEDAPVVFTSRSQTPGAWGGINAPLSAIDFRHVVVEYGGGDIPGRGAICVPELNAGLSTGDGGALVVVDSVFRHNRGAGVGFEGECLPTATFARNELVSNDVPLTTDGQGLGFVELDNILLGNAEDHIQLSSYVMFGSASWADHGLPIWAPAGLSVVIASTLTLNPGVVLRFEPGTGLIVKDSSELLSAGTDSKPVILESTVPGSPWLGIACESGGTASLVGTVFRDADATSCE